MGLHRRLRHDELLGDLAVGQAPGGGWALEARLPIG
jgi:hypothetical protein